MLWAVLASGPSMSQAVADSVRHLKVVAVSDTFRLAPWADALASQDRAWWRARPEALEFAGRKFGGGMEPPPGVERVPDVASGSNSGVLGIRVARMLGARQIVLLGFDGGSDHFFGPHTGTLKNTTPQRIPVHHEQHRQEAHACRWLGIEVWNCTPGTAIEHYTKASLESVLCAHG
jgi:hypothetical protein